MVYDEWGGFFDHVKPGNTPGTPAKARRNGFTQVGFRVPAIVASPFARSGFADHTVYDHTSVLRLIEWRYLGAPRRGARRAREVGGG